jgi:hypothetical protein
VTEFDASTVEAKRAVASSIDRHIGALERRRRVINKEIDDKYKVRAAHAM